MNKTTVMLFFLLLILIGCSADKIENKELLDSQKFNTIQASGELVSSDNAVISPPQAKGMWRYKITFLAPEGRLIEQGKPLIGFDASQLEQTLSEKQNELQTAEKKLETTRMQNDAKSEELKLKLAEVKMNLEKADLKWQQSKGLESKLETQKLDLFRQIAIDDVLKYEQTIKKNIEISSAKMAAVESDVTRLLNEVKQYQSSIDRMMVMSPKLGIVVYKTNHNGEKNSVGDTVSMGHQLIELPSLDAMMVKAEILEADAGRIAIGQEVDIVLDAASDRVYKGRIKKLGSVFRRKSVDQPNIIFDADISIDATDPDIMRPGMAVRLKIFALPETS